ncbi:MAG: ABC transporter permease [Lachnospiraceae bacterium]|nr:ABC transporter permease [Lachnospiraceae bacterium]
MQLVIGILEEGFIYALVSFGAYITFKILDFPDMTVDGSFPFGMCVTAVLILNGVNPFITLPISFIVGCIAGMITGFIHVKFKIRDLLSGIIVMTSLYSMNLRLAGRANLSIFQRPSIFKMVNVFEIGSVLGAFNRVIVLFLIVILLKIILDMYLETKSGYLLRSVGDNEILVTTLGKNKESVKVLGLALANGFAALAGSIYAQHRGSFEISAGTGTLVIAVANVIIGLQLTNVFRKMKPTTSVIFGSLIYRACIGFAMFLGMPPSDLKIITAALLLVVIVLNNKKYKKLVE